jgi:hypothetical protein
MPLRNPISTWDTEYTWQRAANPLFCAPAISTQPSLIPVATGSNKAPMFLLRPGPFNNDCATYPGHQRREQGPEGAPPYSYRDPRTPWGRGRPFAPAFAPAFKEAQSVAIAAANAGSGATGKADRNNALTMDLTGAATARAARAGDDAISPGSRPASARPATAAPRRPPIALSRAPVVGTAESDLYAAGYPQRLRGDARQAGGGTPAMATLSYYENGRTRRFGSPQAWLTSHMAMNVEAHGADAFK